MYGRGNKLKNFLVNITKNIYIFSVLSKLFGVLTGFIYTILFTRYLGPELRGNSAVIINLSTLVSVIMGFGVYQVYPRFKKLEGEILEVFTSNIKGMFMLYCILAIPFTLFLPINMDTKISILIFPMTIFIKQLNYIVLVEYPKRRNLSAIILNIIDLLLIGLLLLFTKANYLILISFLLCKEFIYLVIAAQNLGLNFFKIKYRLNNLFQYIKFGFVPMLTLMLMTINYRVDVLMLNGHVSTADIGIYSLGVSLAERIWIIPDALKDTLISRLSKGKTEIEVAKVIRISLLLIIISIVFVVFFGQFIIEILFGKEFYGAYKITVIMLYGVVGMIFYKMVYSYNVVNGYINVNFILLGFAALINVIGNLFLIPIYGIKGAAYTSVISYLLCGISFLIYFKYKSGIKFKELLFIHKADLLSFIILLKEKGKSTNKQGDGRSMS